jgi:hypothetical protein
MSASRLARSRIVLAAILLVTTGCAAILESVAQEVVGDGGPPSAGAPRTEGQPERPSPMRDASRAAERASPSATYQAGTTIDWTLYRFGAPYSISNALFERERSVGQACRPAPFGLSGGLARNSDAGGNLFEASVGGSSASRPIANVERSERDILDYSVRPATLFHSDGNTLAAHYVASAARLGHQGHPCSASLIAFMWVWGGEPTVTIHR